MTFREIIDSLIDVSCVPEDKRTGDKYDASRKSIHDELATVHDVEVACYHEAGHWAHATLSMNQLGLGNPQCEVIGPRIKYCESENSYDATPTGLSLPGLTNWKVRSAEHLKVMARIAVAGAESVRHFFGPAAKLGDTNDIGRFKYLCEDARNRLGGLIEPPHIYINEARENVREDFERDRFRTVVLLKAEQVKKEQFGPVFDSDTKATQ